MVVTSQRQREASPGRTHASPPPRLAAGCSVLSTESHAAHRPTPATMAPQQERGRRAERMRRPLSLRRPSRSPATTKGRPSPRRFRPTPAAKTADGRGGAASLDRSLHGSFPHREQMLKQRVDHEALRDARGPALGQPGPREAAAPPLAERSRTWHSQMSTRRHRPRACFGFATSVADCFAAAATASLSRRLGGTARARLMWLMTIGFLLPAVSAAPSPPPLPPAAPYSGTLYEATGWARSSMFGGRLAYPAVPEVAPQVFGAVSGCDQGRCPRGADSIALPRPVPFVKSAPATFLPPDCSAAVNATGCVRVPRPSAASSPLGLTGRVSFTAAVATDPQSGPPGGSASTTAVAWADVDGDGDVDLFVGACAVGVWGACVRSPPRQRARLACWQATAAPTSCG